MQRYQGDNFYKNVEWVEKIKTLAAEKGCTPSQLGIACVLAQGEHIITIPDAKRIQYLEENIASERVKLTADDLQSMEAIMPAGSRVRRSLSRNVHECVEPVGGVYFFFRHQHSFLNQHRCVTHLYL